MTTSKRTIDAWRRLLADGVSQAEVAERYGVHPSTIAYHTNPDYRERSRLRNLSPRPVGQRPRMTPEQVEGIRKLFSEGFTITEIARGYGLSKQGVLYHVRPIMRARMQEKAREWKREMREQESATP